MPDLLCCRANTKTTLQSNYSPIKFLFVCFFVFLLMLLILFFFKLYNIVLVLPNIKMNPPQVYLCSPSWTLLPPSSPYQPSGLSQCKALFLVSFQYLRSRGKIFSDSFFSFVFSPLLIFTWQTVPQSVKSKDFSWNTQVIVFFFFSCPGFSILVLFTCFLPLALFSFFFLF